MKGLVKEIVHDPGCGVSLARVVFRDTYKFKLKKDCSWQLKAFARAKFVRSS